MTLELTLLLAAAVFSIGTYGLLTRREAVAMLLSIELMVNAANIVLVAFARFRGVDTQPVVLFVLAITVAEVAVGLALILLMARRHGDTAVDLLSEMRR
jgi:NADH-quinone oxidoreductase subunit K